MTRQITLFHQDKLSIAQNRHKIVSFLLKYGTACTAGKYLEPTRICAIISLTIFRDDPDLLDETTVQLTKMIAHTSPDLWVNDVFIYLFIFFIYFFFKSSTCNVRFDSCHDKKYDIYSEKNSNLGQRGTPLIG